MIEAKGDWILIIPEFEKRVTASGILLKKRKLEKKPDVGVIAFIGVKVASDELKIGLRVFFADDNAHGFKYDGESYIYVKADQIMAVLP